MADASCSANFILYVDGVEADRKSITVEANEGDSWQDELEEVVLEGSGAKASFVVEKFHGDFFGDGTTLIAAAVHDYWRYPDDPDRMRFEGKTSRYGIGKVFKKVEGTRYVSPSGSESVDQEETEVLIHDYESGAASPGYLGPTWVPVANREAISTIRTGNLYLHVLGYDLCRGERNKPSYQPYITTSYSGTYKIYVERLARITYYEGWVPEGSLHADHWFRPNNAGYGQNPVIHSADLQSESLGIAYIQDCPSLDSDSLYRVSPYDIPDTLYSGRTYKGYNAVAYGEVLSDAKSHNPNGCGLFDLWELTRSSRTNLPVRARSDHMKIVRDDNNTVVRDSDGQH